MIRSTSKAILIHNNKILFNQCLIHGKIYFDLPGGGQNQYETMENTLIREVLEETGYLVRITGLAAVGEQIVTDPVIREHYPDYAHRLFHLFFAELTDKPPKPPASRDLWQQENIWIDPSDLSPDTILPTVFSKRFPEILASPHPVYCGTMILPESIYH